MRALETETCPTPSEPASFWNASVPAGSQPVRVPFLIVFDGSAGAALRSKQERLAPAGGHAARLFRIAQRV